MWEMYKRAAVLLFDNDGDDDDDDDNYDEDDSDTIWMYERSSHTQ